MIPILSVTPEDVMNLRDNELRDLVAGLCRCELQKAGLPPLSVRAGGHQDAKDGGLDVVVELPSPSPKQCFFSRQRTGVQVKKPDMPASAIKAEMRPKRLKGALLPSIKELIADCGSYIIVSSSGSVTALALKNRREAIRNTLGPDDSTHSLHTDFLGRDEIAAWANQFPAMALWIKSRLGAAPQAWKPYGIWSKRESASSEYRIDEQVFFEDRTKYPPAKLPIQSGLDRVRQALIGNGSICRLVGLSGTGKTRFAEALFDDRLGEGALEQENVLFTDLGNGPDPSPSALIQQLTAADLAPIIIVDNCPPKLHNELSALIKTSSSKVRLLTIEYDVRDDTPDETQVFKLKGASSDVLAKIVEDRFPRVSAVNRDRISELADGNSRVALSIAAEIQRDKEASSLSDADLIDRLFKQRNSDNSDLLDSARLLSLVYSFDGDDISGSNSELAFLASLNSISALGLYKHLATLQERELLQKRSKWRALLPQLLANHLARAALNRFPTDHLVTEFFEHAPPRLTKSFTHRIGFLHDEPAAEAIVSKVLVNGALLGSPDEFSDDQCQMFEYLAPVSPNLALAAIERSITRLASHSISGLKVEWASRLLRKIAYEAHYFERCVHALIALESKVGAKPKNLSDTKLSGLFQLYLSGTHATPQQRRETVKELVQSTVPIERTIGLCALSELFASGYFSSASTFDFGSRNRDYGFSPETILTRTQWYEEAIELTLSLINSTNDIAEEAKAILAQHLPELARYKSLHKKIESAVREIFSMQYWPMGWVSLKRIENQLRPKSTNGDVISSPLALLAREFAPSTLEDSIAAIAAGERWSSLDVAEVGSESDEADDHEARQERVNARVIELGEQLAGTPELLEKITPRLVERGVFGRSYELARGIVRNIDNLETFWNEIVEQYCLLPMEKRSEDALCGVLFEVAQSNRSKSHDLLDLASHRNEIERVAVVLHCAIGINEDSGVRLIELARRQRCHPSIFRNIGYGRRHEGLSTDQLIELVTQVSSAPEGFVDAIDILGMVYSGDAQPEEALLSLGRELLLQIPFSSKLNDTDDYEFSRIAEKCLRGDQSGLSLTLLKNLLESLSKTAAYHSHFQKYAKALLLANPTQNLDILLDSAAYGNALDRLFLDGFTRRSDLLRQLNPDLVLAWARIEPNVRLPIISRFGPLLELNSKSEPLDDDDEVVPSLHKLQIAAISEANSREPLLSEISQRLFPRNWIGNLSQHLRVRRQAIDALRGLNIESISPWVDDTIAKLDEWIAKHERLEKDLDSRHETFE
jgi:hypothetical protein